MSQTEIEKQIIKYSLFAGAACFIPLPFIDEWAQYWLGKQMQLKILQAHKKQPTSAQLHILSRRHKSFCLGCLFTALIYPVKKLIRTVAIFLSMKAVANESADWIYRGILLHQALLLGWDGESRYADIRSIFNEITKKHTNTVIQRIVKQTFQTAKDNVKKISKGILRRIKNQDLKETEAISPLIDAIHYEVFMQSSSNQQLVSALQKKMVDSHFITPHPDSP